MQVFITNKDLRISTIQLDDKRLLKQILNIYQRSDMLKIPVGYSKHPIVISYCSEQGITFLKDYLKILCCEYNYRFSKTHKYFDNEYEISSYYFYDQLSPTLIGDKDIYTYYQEILKEKWDNGKQPPKWTKRLTPIFYRV